MEKRLEFKGSTEIMVFMAQVSRVWSRAGDRHIFGLQDSRAISFRDVFSREEYEESSEEGSYLLPLLRLRCEGLRLSPEPLSVEGDLITDAHSV